MFLNGNKGYHVCQFNILQRAKDIYSYCTPKNGVVGSLDVLLAVESSRDANG